MDYFVKSSSKIVSLEGRRSLAKGQKVGIARSHERRDTPEIPQIRLPQCQRLLPLQKEHPNSMEDRLREIEFPIEVIDQIDGLTRECVGEGHSLEKLHSYITRL